ncbi:Polyprotein P3-like protein [Drosera capensis]
MHSSENPQTYDKDYPSEFRQNKELGKEDAENVFLVAISKIADGILRGIVNCCINQQVVPKEAPDKCAYPIQIHGVNSTQMASLKLKGGIIRVGENNFRIPFTYSFPMGINNSIQMLIGCNFIRSMQGGLRIEGNTITFYKNVTTVNTSTETVDFPAVVSELDLSVQEYIDIADMVYLKNAITNINFGSRFRPLLSRLEAQGYIGFDPLKHWAKNKCYANSTSSIQDRSLKHATSFMQDKFKRHVEALLTIGVIRPSTSRHRTMAIMVNSGITIDPLTGKEVKGKERMVLNYQTLNDNTYKDQYSLPGINTILKRIGGSQIFSKLDLKSGFHQVAMHPDSITRMAFLVLGRLYEWLVMSFGLKNAPAVFQRKMDNCFAGTEEFITVYIDDILVFSPNEELHVRHLQVMLQRCEQHGLVLSPTKMKITLPEIDFLGATIGKNKIRLQAHIIKKIVDFTL